LIISPADPNTVGGGLLLHLVANPEDPSQLFAAAGRGGVLTSTDQGQTWAIFTSRTHRVPNKGRTLVWMVL
jgi:photosystem II stability/assembly factor-like uncharacterized protein